ncbi:putative metal dependent phosphohydrolase [Salmonella phage NINP13076]|nr:putative metal dependent phosphohydrolase [Salmonella phage NINP13076]
MHYLKTDDFQLMAIAALHDVLEDTDVTASDLVLLGFSNRVKDAVVLLTKKEGQSPDEYFQGIASNYDAIRVKLADLRHNSDVRRLKGLGDKDLLRIRKYQEMYTKLLKIKTFHESILEVTTSRISS